MQRNLSFVDTCPLSCRYIWIRPKYMLLETHATSLPAFNVIFSNTIGLVKCVFNDLRVNMNVKWPLPNYGVTLVVSSLVHGSWSQFI